MAAEFRVEVERQQPHRRRNLRRCRALALDQHVLRELRRTAPGQFPVPRVQPEAPQYIEHPLTQLELRITGNQNPLIRPLHHAQTFSAQGQHTLRMSGTQFAGRLDPPRFAGQGAGIDAWVKQQRARQRLQQTVEGQLLQDQANVTVGFTTQFNEQLSFFETHRLVQDTQRQIVATPFPTEAWLRRGPFDPHRTGQTPAELPTLAEQRAGPGQIRGTHPDLAMPGSRSVEHGSGRAGGVKLAGQFAEPFAAQLELAGEASIRGQQVEGALFQAQRQRADREIAARTPQTQAARRETPLRQGGDGRGTADIPLAVETQRIAIAFHRAGKRLEPFREFAEGIEPPARRAGCQRSASAAAGNARAPGAPTSRRRGSRPGRHSRPPSRPAAAPPQPDAGRADSGRCPRTA
jgi:hypothetical protein